MKYKFIACDYDDTLLPKSGVISDFTKDTIREYIARGGRFAICTGRMFRSIVKIAREFGLHGEIISYQGSLIKNIDTEETLLVNDIDKDLAVDYVEFMKKQNVFPQVYVGDNLCVEKENPYSVDYARVCGVPLNIVGDFKAFSNDGRAREQGVLQHGFVDNGAGQKRRDQGIRRQAFNQQ